jgi:signal transduction histidine kinase/DNA-binding response OmpR family regulator
MGSAGGSRDARGNRLVWLSEEKALFSSLEEALIREGLAPEHVPLHRVRSSGPGETPTALVVEVDEPGRALALIRRHPRSGAQEAPTLVVLHHRDLGLLGPALRRGTLDVVLGPDPHPDLVLARLALLLRSRNEVREVALLRREMTRRLRQLRMIHQVGKTLAFALDPEELLRGAAEALSGVFHYPKSAILLREDETGELVLRAQSGHPEELLAGYRLRPGHGLVGAAVDSGETVNVSDVEADDRYVRLHGSTTRSELAVPIRAGGIVRGAVDLQSDHPAAFDATDREAVETLADEIGAGLANAQLYAELRGRTEEIEDAFQKLRESDQLKDGFLSSISHELRTPLTSIRSFSEILLGAREEDPRTVEEFIGIIHDESIRLTRLVDNLLDISKMNAGMMSWDMVETGPATVLHRAAQAAGSLAKEKRITIDLDLPAALPPVRMDEDRIIQVLLNLLSNAIKFSAAGTTIGIRAREVAPWLEVRVEDQGPGIPPEDRPHIFEKFRQGGDALRDKPPGTGLGLAICKEILQHHGGTIEVDSEVGRGSVFRFRLPLRPDIAVRPDPDPPPPATTPTPETPRVLVVSGSADPARHLTLALRAAGLRATEAAGEEEAVRRIRRQRPDLILLDLLTAGSRTGSAGALLRRAPEAQGIAVRLLALADDPQAARPGADAMLTYPLDPDELAGAIHRLLRLRRPRVLVLERDARRRGFLCAQLRRSAMTPIPASREDEMLKLARTEGPDLAVVGTGRHEALLRAIRSSTALADLPVLLLALADLESWPLLPESRPEAVAAEVARLLGVPRTASASRAHPGR